MNMDFIELWNNYFPVVSVSRIGTKKENPLLNSIYSITKEYIYKKDNLYLLDIKRMSKQPSFSGLFPLETDPAFCHFELLEEELKKGKPVKIIEFFLKEEEKIFRMHNGRNIPHVDGLSEIFINEIINNHNWIFYNSTENSFITGFPDIIHGKYIPKSIYEAFRCFVPRYYASGYIKNPNDKNNIHVKKSIEGIKENNIYFIPTEETFKSMLSNLMNLNTKIVDPIDTMNAWNYYRNIIYDVLLKLNLNKKAEEFETEARDGVFYLVQYIESVIYDPVIREKLEEKINFNILLSKIVEYKGNKLSIYDPVKNKDGEGNKELIDYIKVNDNALDMITDDKNSSRNIYIDLPDQKLEKLRGNWLNPFKTAFKNNEYAQNGQANFSTIKVFSRFVKWLISEILGKYQSMVESELFKDYCRVHELNGCKKCVIQPSGNIDYLIAQSINGNTYNIDECTNCFRFNDHMKTLIPHYNVLKRRLNRFYEQISGEYNG